VPFLAGGTLCTEENTKEVQAGHKGRTGGQPPVKRVAPVLATWSVITTPNDASAGCSSARRGRACSGGLALHQSGSLVAMLGLRYDSVDFGAGRSPAHQIGETNLMGYCWG